jgi:hypothetical protein
MFSFESNLLYKGEPLLGDQLIIAFSSTGVYPVYLLDELKASAAAFNISFTDAEVKRLFSIYQSETNADCYNFALDITSLLWYADVSTRTKAYNDINSAMNKQKASVHDWITQRISSGDLRKAS